MCDNVLQLYEYAWMNGINVPELA